MKMLETKTKQLNTAVKDLGEVLTAVSAVLTAAVTLIGVISSMKDRHCNKSQEEEVR